MCQLLNSFLIIPLICTLRDWTDQINSIDKTEFCYEIDKIGNGFWRKIVCDIAWQKFLTWFRMRRPVPSLYGLAEAELGRAVQVISIKKYTTKYIEKVLLVYLISISSLFCILPFQHWVLQATSNCYDFPDRSSADQDILCISDANVKNMKVFEKVQSQMFPI